MEETISPPQSSLPTGKGVQEGRDSPERCYAELERRYLQLSLQLSARETADKELLRLLLDLSARFAQLQQASIERTRHDAPSREEFDALALRLERVARLLTPIARSLAAPSDDPT